MRNKSGRFIKDDFKVGDLLCFNSTLWNPGFTPDGVYRVVATHRSKDQSYIGSFLTSKSLVVGEAIVIDNDGSRRFVSTIPSKFVPVPQFHTFTVRK